MPDPTPRGGARGPGRRTSPGGRPRRATRSLILSAAAPVAAVLVVVVFAGFALFGTNGWFALDGYRKQHDARQTELVRYEAERVRLENQKRLIERGDPDFADELVRRNTDMIERNEYMVVDH